MTRDEAHKLYQEVIDRATEDDCLHAAQRSLCLNDLFYLLVHILNRPDCDRDWIYERCREVEANPDGYLDLWAREHYKSTIITYALTIQDILKDPEITCGILSYNRPTSKGFLRQIKREFEDNQTLKDLFPDILWANPRRDAPTWSEDNGIVVQRKGNPKEATVEAWGLVDGQPTGRHFSLLIYDDVVTLDSVTTPEMIAKVTDAWALSRNLTSEGGRTRYIGTRYHYADTYKEMLDRQAAVPRLYPGEDADGKPVLMTAERMAEKRREMGPYVYSCQIMLNPLAVGSHKFREDWLKYWPATQYKGLNLYIIVDPANSKRKGSDFTVMFVIGLGADQNYYVIRLIRDRLNLLERTNLLFKLHQDYHPQGVYYEEYGMQADRAHMEDRMERDNYRFHIRPVAGKVAKIDRIERLIPLFEAGRIYLPTSGVEVNSEGVPVDMVKAFIEEEYKAFPYLAHDDGLDCLARVADPEIHFTFPERIIATNAWDAIIPGAIIQVETDESYDPLARRANA